MDYNVEDNTFLVVAVAGGHLTDVDYHSIRRLVVWGVGWLLSMLISLEKNTLRLDCCYSCRGLKVNFGHSHNHFRDQRSIVENPWVDPAERRMDQLEVIHVRDHMDQASRVLTDVGIEASRSETCEGGSWDVVGVEVACWRVQTRQKRSFQVHRIDLDHYR